MEVDSSGANQLSSLGHRAFGGWRKLGVDDDNSMNELPRCLVLLTAGLELNEPLYVKAYRFWTELRGVFDPGKLLDAPEQLYLASYLNQYAAGINPWLIVKASADVAAELGSLDWATFNEAALGASAQAAMARLKERVGSFASRSLGRRRFCQAMECAALNEISRVTAADYVRGWIGDASGSGD